MSNTSNNTMSYRVSNTQTGTLTKKGKWIPNRNDDGDIIYSNKIRITVENPPTDFVFPDSLESSRISGFATAKAEAGETLKTSNSAYRIQRDDDGEPSITEFEATDAMPAAITAVYKPQGLRFTGAL